MPVSKAGIEKAAGAVAAAVDAVFAAELPGFGFLLRSRFMIAANDSNRSPIISEPRSNRGKHRCLSYYIGHATRTKMRLRFLAS